MIRPKLTVLTVGICCLLVTGPVVAYIDMGPTLSRVIREAQTITLAEVVGFSPEKGAVILKKISDFKGSTADDPIKHQLLRANEASVDRAILEWAEPGRRCVLFSTARIAVVCIGEAWYQVQNSDDGWWRIGAPRADLPLAYYGTLSRLVNAIPLILAGKTATITTLPHGVDREGASFDLALNRASLPGLVRVQRVRASKNMPENAMGVGSNPALVIGLGRVGPEELSQLRRQLKSEDGITRADSAQDLGFLGAEAAEAVDDLTKLLDDAVPRVRLAAASALLRIRRKAKDDEIVGQKPREVLAKGLTSDDVAIRRQAARAVALAGPRAAPLTAHLARMLKDPDLIVQRTALQAIATLGPAAAEALSPVTALLENPETAIDAADALGRMGPSAQPALKSLAKLLSSDADGVRWAAIRGMSQIGGPDAMPAVKFLVAAMPRASDVDGYNIMIYFSLLGPVAKDAIPAIRQSRVRNPFLRQTTIWAIDPTTDMQGTGPMGDADVVQYVMESYVRELGDHLRPAAQILSKKIMAGKAGNVPDWGYKLLARFPSESLAVLTPGLADKELIVRERAAVAIGLMGHKAAAARTDVAQALKMSTDEKEQRLLGWCLRELDSRSQSD